MFYKHIILSNDDPFSSIANRKKGIWFHSIVVLTKQEIPENGDFLECFIMHFHGEKGGPIFESNYGTISMQMRIRKIPIYSISLWFGTYGVCEKIRIGDNSYEDGCGYIDMSIEKLVRAVFEKWGKSKIPYVHQHKESYNCIGFSDDVIYFIKYGKWNPRIVENHAKYQLISEQFDTKEIHPCE
jgi:hypothetical protein